MKNIYYLLLCLLLPSSLTAQEPEGKSQWIYPDSNGKLVYKTTQRGDRIMDFSHAGYKGGGVTLPYVPAKLTVHPLGEDEDCTDYIQQAIDMVSALPQDADGFRGAVLLAPGRYVCERTIQIKTNGVVLRGSGSDPSGSVIVMRGGKHTAIVVNNGTRQRAGNRIGDASDNEKTIRVTDKYIPAGSRQLTLEDASTLSVGDNVEIRKPVTGKWVKYLKMNDLVRDGKPQTWIKEGRLLIAERTIAAIDRNTVTLTVPLADAYDARYTDGNTTLRVANDVQRLRQCGVENLRIESPAQAVNHTQALYYALRINGEDCWARDINAMETMESIGIGGRRITLQQINVVRRALHQGASKPAEFAPNGGQILVDRCSVAGDNIWFVALGAGQTGPIVFLNCDFRGNGRIEGHQRWRRHRLQEPRLHGFGPRLGNSLGSGVELRSEELRQPDSARHVQLGDRQPRREYPPAPPLQPVRPHTSRRHLRLARHTRRPPQPLPRPAQRTPGRSRPRCHRLWPNLAAARPRLLRLRLPRRHEGIRATGRQGLPCHPRIYARLGLGLFRTSQHLRQRPPRGRALRSRLRPRAATVRLPVYQPRRRRCRRL